MSLPLSITIASGCTQALCGGTAVDIQTPKSLRQATEPLQGSGRLEHLPDQCDDYQRCEATPEEICKHYCPRANDENVVKDLKESYGFERINVNNFWATEAVLVMIALVLHNLIIYLNKTILNPRLTSKSKSMRGQC